MVYPKAKHKGWPKFKDTDTIKNYSAVQKTAKKRNLCNMNGMAELDTFLNTLAPKLRNGEFVFC
jgi:hypothetical protein